MTTTVPALARLASKQDEWRSLDPSAKLALLEDSLHRLKKDVGPDGFRQLGRAIAKHTKGILDEDCDDFVFVASEEATIIAIIIMSTLEDFIHAYKVRTGADEPKRVKDSEKAPLCAVPTFPLTTPESIAGPTACLKCEAVGDDLKPYAFEDLEDKDLADPNRRVHVVLGAGNQGFLTVVDVLTALFVNNRVVFCKQHPIRGSDLDPIMRRLFHGLYDAGYLDSECDVDIPRTQEILRDPAVHSAHMTGSKATHDAIVWDNRPVEQRDEPNFKGIMTSELGCITPWIVSPAEYTSKELKSTIANIHEAVWASGSTNCNSCKVLILKESWKQGEDLLQDFIDAWEQQITPCAYYPGSEDRWQRFRKEYPEAREIHGKPSTESDSCRLPLLLVELKPDLSTEEGRAKVKKELAFTMEPFCPVLTVVTLPADTPEAFMKDAVEFCNVHLFGTLSACVSVPASVQGSDWTERAIADLEYGSVVLNVCSAYGYACGTWGGYQPRENVKDVQSGVGTIRNRLFLKNVKKSVLRAPCMNSVSSSLGPLRKRAAFNDALLSLALEPSVGHLLKLLSVQADELKSPAMIALGAGIAATAVSIAVRAYIMLKGKNAATH